jgi:Ca-activated chloride channel family protein
MLTKIDLETIRFGEPVFLWLLIVPAVLFGLWMWQLGTRRRDARQYRVHRTLPHAERITALGGLPFWLCLTLAIASTVVALARPRALVSVVRSSGVDLVILQDGSASMHVQDVRGNRWQRSMRFLRVLGESLSWRDDRIAMALFAHVATPQIRLTRDPNTYFFFLDHLDQQSPFRLEDNTTWDTNIELGIYWGLRLIDKDEELRGKSSKAKAFVLVSDGQAWSGEVETSLKVARSRGVPIYVVGVGTAVGGLIPEAPPRPGQDVPVAASSGIRSSLDRASLTTVATAGGGQYLEIDRETDREISVEIINDARSRAGSRVEETTEDLYWRFLAAAAVLVCLGVLFLHERSEIWIALAGGAAVATLVLSMI